LEEKQELFNGHGFRDKDIGCRLWALLLFFMDQANKTFRATPAV
jgi:hypothetical protein